MDRYHKTLYTYGIAPLIHYVNTPMPEERVGGGPCPMKGRWGSMPDEGLGGVTHAQTLSDKFIRQVSV